ncbi:MAG: PTS glucitol/sorbitol transporter subunit IIA [Brevefilum sp.]|nr:PTS glucitol/sorbitol transporter subunit IIA [Brevefilum sp.]
MIKYQATVTEIGPLVVEFVNAGILVFFGAKAPPELREFSIIHDGKELLENVEPGDEVVIDDASYKVLAVGEVANTNLGNLGHLVMKFNGMEVAELPGDVCVEEKPVHPVEIGTVFKILSDQI